MLIVGLLLGAINPARNVGTPMMAMRIESRVNTIQGRHYSFGSTLRGDQPAAAHSLFNVH